MCMIGTSCLIINLWLLYCTYCTCSVFSLRIAQHEILLLGTAGGMLTAVGCLGGLD
jgi:hypothetical protein